MRLIETICYIQDIMQLGVTKIYAAIICLVLDKVNLVLIKHMLGKNFVLVFISFVCSYLTVIY